MSPTWNMVLTCPANCLTLLILTRQGYAVLKHILLKNIASSQLLLWKITIRKTVPLFKHYLKPKGGFWTTFKTGKYKNMHCFIFKILVDLREVLRKCLYFFFLNCCWKYLYWCALTLFLVVSPLPPYFDLKHCFIEKLTNADLVFLTKALHLFLPTGYFSKFLSYLKNLFNNKKEKCLDAIFLRLPHL